MSMQDLFSHFVWESETGGRGLCSLCSCCWYVLLIDVLQGQFVCTLLFIISVVNPNSSSLIGGIRFVSWNLRGPEPRFILT